MKEGHFYNLMVHQNRLITVFLLSLLFSLNVSAVKFYSVNSLFGISMREANSVCKDNNGFIWASSKTGILRLTNDDYRIYHLPYETAGIYHVRLTYKSSGLIVYTNNGQIFSFNPVCDRFDLTFNLGKFLNDNYLMVYKLLVDEEGAWWIASSSGLFKYHSGKLTLVDEISPDRYMITWVDPQHLVVVKKEGISLLDTRSLKFRQVCEYKNPAPFVVSSIFFDKTQNKVWIGTLSSGLFFYDFDSGVYAGFLKPHFPGQPVLAIEANSDSTLLVGVDGQGIWEVNKQSSQVVNVYKESADDPSSLRGNGVYDLFCDENKRVWVCTFSGGVSFFNQASPIVSQVVHQTNNANSLVNNEVNSIIEDRWGKLWFATNNGISCWEPTSNRWRNFYYNKQEQAQVFLSLCEDDNGRIWAGSYSSGVYILDGKTGKELAHYSQKEKGSPVLIDFILDICKDSQGDIWLGGVNGDFVCYRSKENRFRTYSKEPVNAFAELSDNQLLLGCSYGLSLLNKQTGDVQKLLLGMLVRDILILGDEVWIGTSGDGLCRFNYKSGETEKFTTQSGLPSNFINSVVYADGYLWLGTENGLCHFNPRDKSVQVYSSILPLSRTSFNFGSYFKLKNGQLAWGTNNGAVIFAPEALAELPSKGRIFFQDLAVSGRSVRDNPRFRLSSPVDSLKNIDLKYFQNTFSLELLPIGTPSGAKFSWQLEGFDKEWTPPAGNRIVTYTNLPSGQFTLKIKLYDSSMAHVISERAIAIRLIPPFWRTGWFWMLLLVLFSGIMFLSLLVYINRLKQKHTEEKVRFFTNTAHDIRTSLTLIKAPVEELSKEASLSEKGKYYLHLANEQARRLSAVVTQLMDFQKADIGKEQMSFSMVDIVRLISNRRMMLDSFAKSKKIELLFTADRPGYLTAVDEQKMEKIIDNLISNAIKYSHQESQVLIDLKCDEKKWVLQVKDHGIGISRKAQRMLFNEFYRADNAINSKVVGSGIGLLLVKNYVTRHGGRISCESQENVGSTFQVVIPFKAVPEKIKLPPLTVENAASFSSLPDVPQQIFFDGGALNSKEMKILVVEDNDDLLDFMRITLSREFKVFTAVDGIKAWEFISKQMPDLVVSDIMMPQMNGFELCQLMKSTYETSHIPIILLTALSEKTEQLQGLGLGADDYLTKPFDLNLLVQRIKTIIRNREVVREKALKLLKEDIDGQPVLDNEHNDRFVKKMLEVAKANLSNSAFNKDEFASAMNVSSSLLYKKIKSLTDQSPTDFIKNIRMNHAFDLLQKRKHTVTEVSELCGFASVGYFSTVFRKHFGKSPTEILD